MFVTNSPFLLFLPHESTLCTFVFGHFIHHKLLYISFTSAERVCLYDNIVFIHNTMKIISTWESWYTFMFGAQLVFWHKWLPCIIPPWCTLVMCSGHCFFFFHATLTFTFSIIVNKWVSSQDALLRFVKTESPDDSNLDSRYQTSHFMHHLDFSATRWFSLYINIFFLKKGPYTDICYTDSYWILSYLKLNQ